MSSKLKDLVLDQILQTQDKAISLSQFMSMALYHKELGYYSKLQSITKDFITAPEINQLFGEMLFIWLRLSWERIGRPKSFNLVEMGPGMGTLMQDLMKISSRFIDLYQGMNVYLLESSPSLRRIQAEALTEMSVSWIEDVKQVPDLPTIFIANEFFDALPMSQYILLDKCWYENKVGIDSYGNFVFKCCNSNFVYQNCDLQDGAVIEVQEQTTVIMEEIKKHIVQNSGAWVIIDYGYIDKPYVSTLQGIKEHEYISIFSDIGNIDITYHVDFANIGQVITQREFLYSLGIVDRVKMLHSKCDDIEKAKIHSVFDRLTSVFKMGDLFKVSEAYAM